MIISFGKWLRRGKFVVLFVFFTYLLYYALMIVSQWIEPVQRYREPKGHAVKAFYQQGSLEEMTMKERLRLFYWIGE